MLKLTESHKRALRRTIFDRYFEADKINRVRIFNREIVTDLSGATGSRLWPGGRTVEWVSQSRKDDIYSVKAVKVRFVAND